MKSIFWLTNGQVVEYERTVSVKQELYRGSLCYFVRYKPVCKTEYMHCYPVSAVRSFLVDYN